MFLPAALAIILLCGSCNDEWKEEQYERYVSFKAPLNSKGVSPIYVRYKASGAATYKLPLIVSGSTTNDKDMTVHIAVDKDTLDRLNIERFQSRTDLYYKLLVGEYFSIPETVAIKSGENTALMDINFTLNDIDLVDKWVLPLTVTDDPSYDYASNPRKHYKKALLRVMPFNDFSGTYSGTALKTFFEGFENDAPLVKNEVPVYVVNDTAVFFYAGTIDEDRIDRGKYKIYASFDKNVQSITLWSDNEDMQFQSNVDPSYVIEETMDATRPYLLHRYVTINNINYNYTDYTAVPGATISYTVKGSLILERKINTQIPDEDQAIEW
jgi:hypothetical protein